MNIKHLLQRNLLSNGLRYVALAMLAIGLLTYCSPELFDLLPQYYDIDEIPYQQTTLEEICAQFDKYKAQPVIVTITPYMCWHTHRDKQPILQGHGLTASETIGMTSNPSSKVRLHASFNSYSDDPTYFTHTKTIQKLCDEKIPLTIRGYVNEGEKVYDRDTSEKIIGEAFQININAQDITYTRNGVEQRLAIATDSDSIYQAILHLDIAKNMDKLR